MTNLDSILKSRDSILSTKVCLVKAMVFPVVMYGCESWTIKKAKHRRIDAFEPWCWRRLLRVPWTARRSNQSVLKEINPGCSLEGLILKLKLQYLATWCEELTHLKRPSCPQCFPASGSFPVSQFFAPGGHCTGVSASVLPKNTQDWFPLVLTGLILQYKGLSKVFSNTTVQKH